ncbi:hypothetical protein DVH24_029429 [Malus domestica]|uniref:Uncharacterized protein n=1 Tax=Malus domestica TaxID=3750 RepID=A0A498HT18_MALDO|nr:hypothetical protein DVH24_029429 [Malus domestica]
MASIIPYVMTFDFPGAKHGQTDEFWSNFSWRIEKDERRVICLPCHQYLITDKMVWTESLFTLLQSILNYNVHSTQSSDDHIVYQAQQLARIFSNSLKFGNFLLCLVNKCSPLLKRHKLILTKVAEQNKAFLARSLLGKLAGLELSR